MATKRLYRAQNGSIFGVCQGIADWRDLPVGAVRLVFIIIAVCTAVFPCLIIYLVMAIFLPLNPRVVKAPSASSDFEEQEARSSKHVYSTDEEEVSDEKLQSEYERLKKKVEAMEDAVLNKENDWDQRFNSGK